MEALIKTIVWLTNHSLHQHGHHTSSAHAAEQQPSGWFLPLELLGLDGLNYRAAWDALP